MFICSELNCCLFQGLTALKWLAKKTVTECVKMGRAFKCRLPPSNATVTQGSLVSNNGTCRLSINMVLCYCHVAFDAWQSDHRQQSWFSRCIDFFFETVEEFMLRSIGAATLFASKGQLSLKKVKVEHYKSHTSLKDQHFLMAFISNRIRCYICHHNIPSWRSNSSCYSSL